MEVEIQDSCPECGMAYSFFFRTQFHKADCSIAKKAYEEDRL